MSCALVPRNGMLETYLSLKCFGSPRCLTYNRCWLGRTLSLQKEHGWCGSNSVMNSKLKLKAWILNQFLLKIELSILEVWFFIYTIRAIGFDSPDGLFHNSQCTSDKHAYDRQHRLEYNVVQSCVTKRCPQITSKWLRCGIERMHDLCGSYCLARIKYHSQQDQSTSTHAAGVRDS